MSGAFLGPFPLWWYAGGGVPVPAAGGFVLPFPLWLGLMGGTASAAPAASSRSPYQPILVLGRMMGR